jgi:hypothetical protein
MGNWGRVLCSALDTMYTVHQTCFWGANEGGCAGVHARCECMPTRGCGADGAGARLGHNNKGGLRVGEHGDEARLESGLEPSHGGD